MVKSCAACGQGLRCVPRLRPALPRILNRWESKGGKLVLLSSEGGEQEVEREEGEEKEEETRLKAIMHCAVQKIDIELQKRRIAPSVRYEDAEPEEDGEGEDAEPEEEEE